MFLNPFMFFLAKSPCLIVWDYKSHRQYELDTKYSKRLLALVENPRSFDNKNSIDLEFLDAGIISREVFAQGGWGWDELSKIFHVGTKNIPCECTPKDSRDWADLYYGHCASLSNKPLDVSHKYKPDFSKEISLREVCLKRGKVKNAKLCDVLLNRKTCRVFERKAGSMEDFSSILYLAFGYLTERGKDIEEFIPVGFRSRRSSPSGGGLNASEAYVYVGNVESLKSGIYYYQPSTHSLVFMSALSETLGELLEGQHFINDIPFGIFLTSRLDKMWWKYKHSRAYRVSLLDIGHISQTFQLVATAAGLKTWLTAALTDDRIEGVLGISGFSEQPMLFVGAGYSNGDVFSKELAILLKESSS